MDSSNDKQVLPDFFKFKSYVGRLVDEDGQGEPSPPRSGLMLKLFGLATGFL